MRYGGKRVSRSVIPPSVKSPLSLKADYANPMLYGWASILVGVLSLFVGIPMLFMSSNLSAAAVITGLGAALVVVGVWMVKRGE
jgi:uncharacterized membrane protein HdeD (DUF308 family)